MTDGQEGNGVPPSPPENPPGKRRRSSIRARGQPRAITISLKYPRDILGDVDTSIIERIGRPRTRADCSEFGRHAERPCPFVGCKHHLYLDINPETGSIKINFPDREPWELEHSCALDVAELGGITLEEVGLMTNLTRERVRQVEVSGLLKLKMYSPGATGSHDYVHPDPDAIRAAAQKARRRRRV